MAPSTVFTGRQEEVHLVADIAKTASTTAHADLQTALAAARERFTKRNPNSLRLHEEAAKSLPGGNTRSLLHTAPFPVYMKEGKGWQLVDEDGHTYTDFVAEMTAAIYGHSQPIIQSAITAAMHTYGLNLGATTKLESQYASLICSRFSIDRVRFCNSGTEANLHALAGARKFTGKRKVVVFANGYHGAVFTFSGGKVAENNVDHDDWIIVPYNDIDATVAAIRSEGVAAVIVEGMQGAGGALPGTPQFLKAIETTAKQAGVLFILDEVMTSRSAPGGLAEIHSLKPDIKTFGKYLGSGLAFGAFGGREEVMRVYDPRESGALAHSGTFNNNTLAMAAGYAGLSQIFTPEACVEFNILGNYMCNRLNEASKGTKLSYTGVGTILCAHVTVDGRTTVLRSEDGKHESDIDLKDLMWMEMQEEGFWISRRGSLALILGTPKGEIDRFVAAYQRFLERHHELVQL